MLNLKLKPLLRADFLRNEDGAIAIETIIIFPVLFWGFMAMFSTFDAYRQYSMHQKAAYTISDMISRETLPIDSDYLDGAHKLFDALTRTPQDSSIRVSILNYDATNAQMNLDWSKTRGSSAPLVRSNIETWTTRLPAMVDGERIIVVETSAHYDPPFKTGLEAREIQNFIFTRPRYAPQVLYSDTPVG